MTAQEDQSPPSMVSRMGEGAAIATTAGALLYALLRFGLNNFYDDLGVTAEEAGWGLERALTTFAPALVLLPVFIGYFGVILLGEDWFLRKRSTKILVFSAGTVIMLIAAGFYFDAKADSVKDGKNPYDQPLFPISVPCVHIEPATEAAVLPREIGPETTLMLLAKSDAGLLLFDSERDVAVRLPGGAFSVTAVGCA